MSRAGQPFLTRLSAPDREGHWISVSDLMAGLMMIFLLISIVYMVKTEAEAAQIERIAVLYDQLRTELYADLLVEFENDLPKWGAEIDSDLGIRFKEPDVLFEMGSANLQPRFQQILDDFFPRYIALITSPKYVEDIAEVRIEGHTSSRWGPTTSEEESYILNMALSQARTRTTLEYVLQLSGIADRVDWLRRNVTANGLSFSRRILDATGNEDFAGSRRVEFRLRTNAEQKIARILELADP